MAEECSIRIEPPYQHVVSKQALAFAAINNGLCNNSDYEWLLESSIGSTCDQNGNYTAGSNLETLKAALDTITVIDHANGDMSAQASVTVFFGCPARQLYGEHSEEVTLLRKFRDDVARATPEGKHLITLYYQWGPTLLEAMEKNEAFKAEVKQLIDAILPMMRAVVR
jgi:hypothetical protein